MKSAQAIGAQKIPGTEEAQHREHTQEGQKWQQDDHQIDPMLLAVGQFLWRGRDHPQKLYGEANPDQTRRQMHGQGKSWPGLQRRVRTQLDAEHGQDEQRQHHHGQRQFLLQFCCGDGAAHAPADSRQPQPSVRRARGRGHAQWWDEDRECEPPQPRAPGIIGKKQTYRCLKRNATP